MRNVVAETVAVKQELELRVVQIYGKYRGRVYDNGKLVVESYSDNEGDALVEIKDWVYKNYNVIPENLEE